MRHLVRSTMHLVALRVLVQACCATASLPWTVQKVCKRILMLPYEASQALHNAYALLQLSSLHSDLAYGVSTVRPCHITSRSHDRLGNQLTTVRTLLEVGGGNKSTNFLPQLFASVFTASHLHATVKIGRLGYRVADGADISSLFGLFGENDVDAFWDFKGGRDHGAVYTLVSS